MLIQTVRSAIRHKSDSGYEIRPSDISLSTLASTADQLFGKGHCSTVAYFVRISQLAGYWAGAVWENRMSDSYSNPVVEGGKLVLESPLHEVWVYELSRSCVVALHRMQPESATPKVSSLPILDFLRELRIEEYAPA